MIAPRNGAIFETLWHHDSTFYPSEVDLMLTHFVPLISFDTPWKHQKTRSFLFSGVSKEICGMKWVNEYHQLMGTYWFKAHYSLTMALQLLGTWIVSVDSFVPSAPFLYPLKTSENRVEKECIGNKWVKRGHNAFLKSFLHH